MIRHVIFDCDGVLLDTEIVAAEVMASWLSKNGHAITTARFIERHTGKTFSGIMRELQKDQLLESDLDIAAGVSEIEGEVKANIRLINGLENALDTIALPKSVVSNSGVDYVRRSLQRYAVDHHFEERIFSSEMVALPKPSPLVYELAIKTLQVPKEEIVVIEDSSTGVQAALAAGLQVIGFLGGSHILPGHADRLTKVGASKVAHDHSDLVDILANTTL